MTGVLESELEQFQLMKPDLLAKYPGQFALIHGTEFVGAFEKLDDAYNQGVERFGLGPFLVKKITEKEEEYRNQALYLGLTHASL